MMQWALRSILLIWVVSFAIEAHMTHHERTFNHINRNHPLHHPDDLAHHHHGEELKHELDEYTSNHGITNTQQHGGEHKKTKTKGRGERKAKLVKKLEELKERNAARKAKKVKAGKGITNKNKRNQAKKSNKLDEIEKRHAARKAKKRNGITNKNKRNQAKKSKSKSKSKSHHEKDHHHHHKGSHGRKGGIRVVSKHLKNVIIAPTTKPTNMTMANGTIV